MLCLMFRYRWAGSARLDVSAVAHILRLKSYRARLMYLPAHAVSETTTMAPESEQNDLNGHKEVLNMHN
jgi:hypothetical protein